MFWCVSQRRIYLGKDEEQACGNSVIHVHIEDELYRAWLDCIFFFFFLDRNKEGLPHATRKESTKAFDGDVYRITENGKPIKIWGDWQGTP